MTKFCSFFLELILAFQMQFEQVFSTDWRPEKIFVYIQIVTRLQNLLLLGVVPGVGIVVS